MGKSNPTQRRNCRLFSFDIYFRFRVASLGKATVLKITKTSFIQNPYALIWNFNNDWWCYVLLNWKLIWIKSKRGISLNTPCKQIWSAQALPSQVSKSKSSIAGALTTTLVLDSALPPCLQLVFGGFLQRSWKGEKQNISFQMNLDIENRYLPTISWDFKIFLIYLIITQSPGNSYCSSTVLASLPSPSTAAQVQSWPKKNDSKFNLSHCGRGGGQQSKWLVSSLNLQNHSGLFNWPPLKVLSASR